MQPFSSQLTCRSCHWYSDHGEFEHDDHYSAITPPVWHTPPFLYFPKGVTASKQQDTTNNTYSCLRTLEDNPPAPANTSVLCRFYQDDDKWKLDDACECDSNGRVTTLSSDTDRCCQQICLSTTTFWPMRSR